MSDDYEFDVALSFAGEDRRYVEEVASVLTKMGFRVFYDKYETVTLWGKNLYTHLQEVYFQRARYTVMFISQHYKAKLWTNHERESAQARAFAEKGEYILPARFDATQISGVLPTVGYIDLAEYTPAQFAQIVKEKIGFIPRSEFFPDNPDRLFGCFGKLKKSDRQTINLLAHTFFDTLKLMTPEERIVLATASNNACPAGLYDNVHLKIEYLSRLTHLSKEELLALFARLDCLRIKSRLYTSEDHEDEHSLVHSSEIIEITYEPLSVNFTGNATYVMVAIFDCLSEHYCEHCAEQALMRVDLSVLGELTAMNEVHTEMHKAEA